MVIAAIFKLVPSLLILLYLTLITFVIIIIDDIVNCSINFRCSLGPATMNFVMLLVALVIFVDDV